MSYLTVMTQALPFFKDSSLGKIDQLEAILRSSPDAILTLTVEGVVLSWNPGAEVMFGYSEADALGKSVQDLILGEDDRAIFRPFDPVLHGHEARQYEAKRVRRDGISVDVMMTVCSIRNNAGEVAAVSAIYRDLGPDKRSKVSMDSANSVLRHLLETSPFGVYAVDADFRLALVGVGARKVFENVSPLIGRDFGEIMHCIWLPDFAAEVTKLFRHTLATGEPYRSANTIGPRADVEEIGAYDWKIERVLMPDGRFGVVCHFYDFSERVRLEDALRLGEERLRLALDSAELGVWTQNIETGQIEWNDHAQRILGYGNKPAGTIGQWRERVHPDDLGRIAQAYRQARLSGTAYQAQHRIITPEGQVKWIQIHGKLIKGSEGEMFTGIFADITEQKRSEENIRFLMGEVNHRSKNLLAVVQAVATQTAKSSEEKAYVSRLADRILGLAASQDLVLEGHDRGINLNTLVHAQLRAFSDRLETRIQISGPAVHLNSAATQSIGMAIHELATNTLKYGALSDEAGIISIIWEYPGQDDSMFKMSWTETGGPRADQPKQTGFGQLVIVNMLKASLKADVKLEYAPAGLVWQLTAPGERIVEMNHDSSPYSKNLESIRLSAGT